MNNIICIGASNIDSKAFCSNLIHHSSNSVKFIKSFGGCARNVAENLARLEIPVSLLTFTGNDFEGKSIIEYCKNSGIDTSLSVTVDGFNTGTYTAILDNFGELSFGFDDMNIYDAVSWSMIEQSLEILKKYSFIYLETNLPAIIVDNIIKFSRKEDIPLIIDPISIQKSQRLPENLDNIFLLLPNIYEAKAIIGYNHDNLNEISDYFLKKGLQNLVVTLGDKGIFFADKNSELYLNSYASKIKDVTGAGDSFAAGLIFGLLKGNNVKNSLDYGLRASALTVNSEKAVSEEMNIKNLLGMNTQLPESFENTNT